jgi:DNA repair ATPase RecN
VLTAAVAGAGPAGALAASDPVSTLQSDLTTLRGAVASAHDALVADLAKIQSDATSLQGTTDKAAARATLVADLRQLRTDWRSTIDAVQTARKQVQADLRAAKDAKVDPSAIRPLLREARAQDRAAAREVRQAARRAAQAFAALVRGFQH